MDRGLLYSFQNSKKFVVKIGFKHHICTPENLSANGFVEVIQKVVVKLVHLAVLQGKDPAKELQEYLIR